MELYSEVLNIPRGVWSIIYKIIRDITLVVMSDFNLFYWFTLPFLLPDPFEPTH